MTMPQTNPTLESEAALIGLKSLIRQLRATTQELPNDFELTNLYQTAPMVYRASNKWAAAVSSVPLIAKLNGEVLPDIHPLQRLFSDRLQRRELLKRTDVTMSFWGTSLIEKRRNLTRRVFKLDWINPNNWQKMTDTRLGLIGWQISGGYENSRKLRRRDGVYFNSIDFDDDFEGIGPAEVAFMAASVNAEIAQTMLALFRNRAVPAMLIQPAKDGPAPSSKMNEQTPAKRMVSLLQNMVKGSKNAGRTIVDPSRWEVLKLEQGFDSLPVGVIKEDVLVDVSIAFDIPLSLLVSGHANFAGQETDRREWWQGSVKPRCEWYGDGFTQDVAAEYGVGYTIEPDFTDVAALKEDVATKTNIVASQLGSTIISIQESREELGHDPDPDLPKEGLYVVGGQIVPASQLGSIISDVPGEAWEESGTVLVDDKPHPLPARPQETINPEPTKSADKGGFIPGTVWREFENWERLYGEGRAIGFKAVQIPNDVAAWMDYVFDAGWPGEQGDVFGIGRDLYRAWHCGDVGSKSFATVASAFRSAFFDLLQRAFIANIKGEPALSRKEFGDLARTELTEAVSQAFREGLSEGGVNVEVTSEDFTDDERAYLKATNKQQRSYMTKYANRVYKVMPLRAEALALQKQANRIRTNMERKQELTDAAAERYQAFRTAKNGFLTQIQVWVNKGLREAYQQGLLFAGANQMVKWVRDPAKDSCRTCKALDGQVHRRSSFHKRGFVPGADTLECWGKWCGCKFETTAEKPRGALSRVPGGSKSLKVSAEPEQTTYWAQPIHAGEYDDSGMPLGFGFQLIFPSDPAIQGVRTQLDSLQNALNEPLQPVTEGVEAIVWIEPNEWHLSLCYSDAEYPIGLVNAFKEIPVPTLGIVLDIDRVEVWDTPQDGQVLVLRLVESILLRQLQENIYYLFSDVGVAPTEFSRPAMWKPHITLAHNWQGATPLIDSVGEIVADQLRLMTSAETIRDWSVEDAPEPSDSPLITS